jgi:hypothetical protein
MALAGRTPSQQLALIMAANNLAIIHIQEICTKKRQASIDWALDDRDLKHTSAAINHNVLARHVGRSIRT